MDEIEKVIKKLTESERTAVKKVIKALLSERFEDLDIKKLKGYDGVFRVRKGKIRIVYQTRGKNLIIIKIDRRREGTYKF